MNPVGKLACFLVIVLLVAPNVILAATSFDQVLADLEQQYQIPSGCLAKVAKAESGGNPNAKNPGSTASGMFQWLTSSWAGASRRITPDGRPLDPSQRFNPSVAAKVTAASLRDSQNLIGGLIQQAGIDGCLGLYMAHFLGPAGARAFLRAYIQNPQQSACTAFPRECAANRGFMGGKTLAGLLQEASRRLGTGGSINVAGNFEDQNGNPYSRTNADIPANAYLPRSTPIPFNTERTYPTNYDSSGRPILDGSSTSPTNSVQAVGDAVSHLLVQPRQVSKGSSIIVSWTSVGMSKTKPCKVSQEGGAGRVVIAEANEGTRVVPTKTEDAAGTWRFFLACTSVSDVQESEQTATISVQ
jgi:hypothetical protein